MIRSIKTIGIAILLGLFWSSCGEDKPSVEDNLLLGRWELVEASVNGATTDRLRNLYFVFLPDTSVQTNIMGSETNYSYELNEMQVNQHSDPPMVYQLQQFSDSTLVLETEIRGSAFLIHLKKAQPKIITESR